MQRIPLSQIVHNKSDRKEAEYVDTVVTKEATSLREHASSTVYSRRKSCFWQRRAGESEMELCYKKSYKFGRGYVVAGSHCLLPETEVF